MNANALSIKHQFWWIGIEEMLPIDEQKTIVTLASREFFWIRFQCKRHRLASTTSAIITRQSSLRLRSRNGEYPRSACSWAVETHVSATTTEKQNLFSIEHVGTCRLSTHTHTMMQLTPATSSYIRTSLMRRTYGAKRLRVHTCVNGEAQLASANERFKGAKREWTGTVKSYTAYIR